MFNKHLTNSKRNAFPCVSSPLSYILSRLVNPIATNRTINDATMLYTISAKTAENSTTYCPANSVVGKMFRNGYNNGSEKS